MSVFVFVCSSAYCPFSSNYIHMQCPFRPLYIYIFSILYQSSAQFFLFSKNKNKKSAHKPFAAGHKNLKCPQIHVRRQKILAACTNQTRELDSAVRERLAVIKQGQLFVNRLGLVVNNRSMKTEIFENFSCLTFFFGKKKNTKIMFAEGDSHTRAAGLLWRVFEEAPADDWKEKCPRSHQTSSHRDQRWNKRFSGQLLPSPLSKAEIHRRTIPTFFARSAHEFLTGLLLLLFGFYSSINTTATFIQYHNSMPYQLIFQPFGFNKICSSIPVQEDMPLVLYFYKREIGLKFQF